MRWTKAMNMIDPVESKTVPPPPLRAPPPHPPTAVSSPNVVSFY